jgi:6-phosphogluconate dehydrogenase
VKEPDDRHPAQQEEKPSDKRSSGAIQKYEAELESLKTQCQSEVNSLKSQIQATVAQNKNVSADNLKSKFLQKFVEAEAQCDGRFQAILAQAAEAGVPEPVMQSWKATYESMKSSAQADILTAAEQLLKKN